MKKAAKSKKFQPQSETADSESKLIDIPSTDISIYHTKLIIHNNPEERVLDNKSLFTSYHFQNLFGQFFIDFTGDNKL